MPIICKEFDNKAKLIALFIKSIRKAKENNIIPSAFKLHTTNDTELPKEVIGVCLKSLSCNYRYIIGGCTKDHYLYFIINDPGKEKSVKCKLNNKEWKRLMQTEYYNYWMDNKVTDALKYGKVIDNLYE